MSRAYQNRPDQIRLVISSAHALASNNASRPGSGPRKKHQRRPQETGDSTSERADKFANHRWNQTGFAGAPRASTWPPILRAHKQASNHGQRDPSALFSEPLKACPKKDRHAVPRRRFAARGCTGPRATRDAIARSSKHNAFRTRRAATEPIPSVIVLTSSTASARIRRDVVFVLELDLDFHLALALAAVVILAWTAERLQRQVG